MTSKQKKLKKFCIGLDAFGHPVSVTYKGRDSYQSLIGSIFSILSYLLMTANLLNLVVIWFDNSK